MDWLRKWMYGRYGVDQLTMGLLILSIVLGFIFIPFHNILLQICSYVPIGIAYYRICSKQIYKRQQENNRFLHYYLPIKKRCLIFARRIKECRTHKYFKCPKCGQTLRVPRGKGNLAITCPKCHTTFHNHA